MPGVFKFLGRVVVNRWARRWARTSRWKKALAWARHIKRDVLTVYFAARDPRTPVPLRLLALLVAAYALSPIDLIPDVIPVLGYLDDLLIVPLGLLLVIRWLPPPVLAASRAKAQALAERPRNYWAAAIFVMVWLLLVVVVACWVF